MKQYLWTSDAIARATGGTASAAFGVDDVTFDSREVIGGELFVALGGAMTDGHEFIDKAVAAGAAGCIVARDCPHPHVRVTDTMTALEALGRAARARTDARILGVTGSVGKTSVKEALRQAFARAGRTHASIKSYNNHTGVPLSLARMPADARFGVFEMGMNHAGELARLTRQVRPHVAVVTWVASAHREHFASEEAIADAKAEIFEGLEPGGTAIIPFDNAHSARLRAAARAHAQLTFGEGEGADIRALRVTGDADGSDLVVGLPGDRTLHCRVNAAGRHWVNNALAVIAAVHAAGGDVAQAGIALAELPALAGRGRRIRVPLGPSAVTIIDEAYNANPASMTAALAVLRQVAPAAGGRRIAVLGAMKELGELSESFRASLAAPLADSGAQVALLVGNEMSALAQHLPPGIAVMHVATVEEAMAQVPALLGPGDVVLVKGSNSVGLGRLVAQLSESAA